MKYTRTTKVLFTLGVMFLVLSFLGLFFKKTRADVLDVYLLSFTQQGYSGVPNYGSYGASGGQIDLAIAEYRYKIDSDVYTGKGLANDFDGETVEIKYLPIAPSFSISSSWPYSLLGFLFLFLAVGVRSIVLWVRVLMVKGAQARLK